MRFSARFRLSTLVASLFVLALLIVLDRIRVGSEALAEASNREVISIGLAAELQLSSDELTRLARAYVVTGDSRYADQYWQIIAIRDGREPRSDGQRIALKELLKQNGFTAEEFALLQQAEDNSNALVATETAAFEAMKGRFMPEGTPASRNPDDYRASAAPDPAFAIRIMYDEAYHAAKATITQPIAQARERVTQRVRQAVRAKESRLRALEWLALGLGVALFLLLSLTHLLAQRPVLKAIASVTADLDRINSGTIDLSRRLDVQSADELGDLARAFDSTLARLAELVARITTAATALSDVASDITSAAQKQKKTSSEFGASTNQIAASTNEITATSRGLLETISQVTATTVATADVAVGGRNDLERMEAAMQSLSTATASISGKLAVIAERANNIGAVVTTITQIADQTNLLSLNAGIEAEKAGEHGLGFSVVAREIRRLADQTAVATRDIERIVKEMQNSVSSGVMEMDRFDAQVRTGVTETTRIGDQLGGLIKGVETLRPRLEQAEQGMQSQVLGASQINDAMRQLREIAMVSGESSNRLQATSTTLLSAIESLQSEVAKFRGQT